MGQPLPGRPTCQRFWTGAYHLFPREAFMSHTDTRMETTKSVGNQRGEEATELSRGLVGTVHARMAPSLFSSVLTGRRWVPGPQNPPPGQHPVMAAVNGLRPETNSSQVSFAFR